MRGFFLFNALCDRGDIVDRARLVVDMHDGDEGRFIVHKLHKRVGVDTAIGFDRCKTRLDPAAFQRFEALEHRGVFPRRGNGVPAPGGGEDRLIIRLRPA